MTSLEARDRASTFVPHAYEEHLADLGEIRMNYATIGSPDQPALLLVPGQTESWWGYEQAMPLLAEHFQVFAVDLRGQGRSTWTPGRYTLDIMGNDLARFIDLVIGRPVTVSGNSSGGVLAAWLSAYGKPGQATGAVMEDPPLFACELHPSCGQSIREGLGPVFAMWSKWLGDQWSVGDWKGMQAAAPSELPAWMMVALIGMRLGEGPGPGSGEVPQNMKEYDPEWARAFYSGTATETCDNGAMLASVRTPVLFTHHFRAVDGDTGTVLGAISDQQADRARELIEGAGQPCTYVSLPKMAHGMHRHDPALFTSTVSEWALKRE
jgi:pimeloyl-ACP methyl ester carboxylesterase